MPIISELPLKSKISSPVLPSVFFIFGNDAYLKKIYVDKIVSRITTPDDDFNYIKFYENADLQQVYDAKNQYPMMADKKCVILCDYDFEKADKNSFDKILNLVGEPVDTTVFIMLCNGLEVDSRKSDRLRKIVEAVEKCNGVCAELNHRTVPDLVKMLNLSAQKNGTPFENGAAAYLIESCGTDLMLLKSETDKLYAYAVNKPITKSMIDTVCVKTVEASVYNMASEIISRNTSAALKLLDELYFMRVEPIIILYNISSAFVDMYRAVSAEHSGIGINEASVSLGYKGREFVLRRAANNAKNINDKTLSLCFDEILAADMALKGYSSDGRTKLEELIVRLIYIISKGEKID